MGGAWDCSDDCGMRCLGDGLPILPPYGPQENALACDAVGVAELILAAGLTRTDADRPEAQDLRAWDILLCVSR